MQRNYTGRQRNGAEALFRPRSLAVIELTLACLSVLLLMPPLCCGQSTDAVIDVDEAGVDKKRRDATERERRFKAAAERQRRLAAERARRAVSERKKKEEVQRQEAVRVRLQKEEDERAAQRAAQKQREEEALQQKRDEETRIIKMKELELKQQAEREESIRREREASERHEQELSAYGSSVRFLGAIDNNALMMTADSDKHIAAVPIGATFFSRARLLSFNDEEATIEVESRRFLVKKASAANCVNAAGLRRYAQHIGTQIDRLNPYLTHTVSLWLDQRGTIVKSSNPEDVFLRGLAPFGPLPRGLSAVDVTVSFSPGVRTNVRFTLLVTQE